jgi:hypothetical protein
MTPSPLVTAHRNPSKPVTPPPTVGSLGFFRLG